MKNWSSSFLGGVFGISFAAILNLIYWLTYWIFGNPYNILGTINFPFQITSDYLIGKISDLVFSGESYVSIPGWLVILFSLVVWFILGAIIGWVVGKIKSRKQTNLVS